MTYILKSGFKSLHVLMFLIALTFGANNAFAGSGHSHNASKATVKRNAVMEVNRLAKVNKIPSSWKDSTLLKSQREGNLWVVSFENSNIIEKEKSVLYIYLSSYGKPRGATYKRK